MKLVDATAQVEPDHVDPDKGQPEFRAHRWMRFDDLIGIAVDFRRPLYEHLARIVPYR